MSSAPKLPEAFDPRQAARGGERFAGSLPVSRFHRLADLLVEPAGEVAVNLQVHADDGGRPVVAGEIRVAAQMLCQRCLEPMALELIARPRLTVVAGEDMAPDDGTEYVLCAPGERLVMADLVEDELILALPVVALHGPDSGCRAPAGGDAGNADQGVAESPFAVLKRTGRDPED